MIILLANNNNLHYYKIERNTFFLSLGNHHLIKGVSKRALLSVFCWRGHKSVIANYNIITVPEQSVDDCAASSLSTTNQQKHHSNANMLLIAITANA